MFRFYVIILIGVTSALVGCETRYSDNLKKDHPILKPEYNIAFGSDYRFDIPKGWVLEKDSLPLGVSVSAISPPDSSARAAFSENLYVQIFKAADDSPVESIGAFLFSNGLSLSTRKIEVVDTYMDMLNSLEYHFIEYNYVGLELAFCSVTATTRIGDIVFVVTYTDLTDNYSYHKKVYLYPILESLEVRH